MSLRLSGLQVMYMIGKKKPRFSAGQNESQAVPVVIGHAQFVGLIASCTHVVKIIR